jgi:hypothetical protein
MYAVLKAKYSYWLKELIKEGEKLLLNLKLFIDSPTRLKT